MKPFTSLGLMVLYAALWMILLGYYLKSDAWITEHKHSFTDAFSTTTYQSSENYERRGSGAA